MTESNLYTKTWIQLLRSTVLSSIIATVTASLAVQLAVLFLLVYGFILKRKFRYRQHGFVMTIAVVLHTVMILSIMIPSFILAVVPEYIIASPFEAASIVGLIHAILGSIAVTLGAALVAAWRFNKDFTGCFARRKLMLPTLTVWVAALGFGITLYVIFIGPLLAA